MGLRTSCGDSPKSILNDLTHLCQNMGSPSPRDWSKALYVLRNDVQALEELQRIITYNVATAGGNTTEAWKGNLQIITTLTESVPRYLTMVVHPEPLENPDSLLSDDLAVACFHEFEGALLKWPQEPEGVRRHIKAALEKVNCPEIINGYLSFWQ